MTQPQEVAKECLIKGLQAHISFLQDCLLDPGDGQRQVERLLEEERKRSGGLLKHLEMKSLLCEDLAARNQSLEAKLLLKEQELAALAALATKEKRGWDDDRTTVVSGGCSSARSSATEEEEDVIEVFVASLVMPPGRLERDQRDPRATARSVPPLERQRRRQEERCRSLGREVSHLSATLQKLRFGAPRFQAS